MSVTDVTDAGSAVTVRLEPVTRRNWREAARVRLREGQLPLVAGHEPVVYGILAKQYLHEAGFEWHALAVYEGDRIVGVLAMVDELELRGCFALYHLAIAGAEQGRGLGRAATTAALAWAAERGAGSVRLTVNTDNVIARALYESLGFEYGESVDDDLGMTRSLA
jgi:diamine N-acetyltransferase